MLERRSSAGGFIYLYFKTLYTHGVLPHCPDWTPDLWRVEKCQRVLHLYEAHVSGVLKLTQEALG